MKSRLLIVGGGLMILLVIIMVVGTLLSSGKSGTQIYADLAAEQQEIMRVAQSGFNISVDPATRGIAATAELSLASQQKRLIEQLKANGNKINDKDLLRKKSSQNDKALEQAKIGGRFDETFLTLLRTLLTAYISHATVAYKQTKDNKIKVILADAVNSSTVLVKKP